MVNADWKRWNFRWHLKVDKVSIERMCAGREFQVEGADTEKLPAIPGGLVKRFVLDKCKDLDTRSSWPFSRLLASFSNLAGGGKAKCGLGPECCMSL